MHGLFKLNNFENIAFENNLDNDIMNISINENGEFAHRNADTNHPEEHFDTNATGGKNTSMSIPGGLSETPKSKPYDASSISIPEGDGETPKSKPYDASSISIPNKVTLTSDQYNSTLASLKQSFKECVEVIEVLERADVVEKTLVERQEEYMERVLGDQILAAYEDGPLFEAVGREDKDDVKNIVRSLRGEIKDYLDERKIKFYKPNLIGRILTIQATAIQQLWSTRLWQVLGIVLIENGNIRDLTNTLTKKYESELNGYKILYVKTLPSIADLFRLKFGWKNSKDCYFLLVDKKVPKELTEFQKEIDKDIKDDSKEEDVKNDSKEDVKEEK